MTANLEQVHLRLAEPVIENSCPSLHTKTALCVAIHRVFREPVVVLRHIAYDHERSRAITNDHARSRAITSDHERVPVSREHAGNASPSSSCVTSRAITSDHARSRAITSDHERSRAITSVFQYPANTLVTRAPAALKWSTTRGRSRPSVSECPS